jgi:hypothetical protein
MIAALDDLTIVRYLLERGANVHTKLPETNDSAVKLAARYGDAEIARLLGQVD